MRTVVNARSKSTRRTPVHARSCATPVCWAQAIGGESSIASTCRAGRLLVHTTIVAFSGDATESGPSEFRVVNMNKQAADTPNVGSKHNWAYNVQVTGGGEWVCESNYDREFDADWHCAEYFVDAGAQTYDCISTARP